MFSTAFICRGLFVLLHAPPCSRCIWQLLAHSPDLFPNGDRKQSLWRNKPGCFRETNLPSSFAGSSGRLAGRRRNAGDSSSSTASRRKSTTGAGGEEELDEARELLTKYSVEEVAKRLSEAQKLFGTPSKEDNSESAKFAVIASPWNLWPRYCMCVAVKSSELD